MLRNIQIQTGSDAAANARAEFWCVSKDAVESDQSLTFAESWRTRRESIISLVYNGNFNLEYICITQQNINGFM